jgi:hypothetical protein
MPFPGIGSGKPLILDVTVDPANILANTTLALSLTVPGAIPGQVFLVKADSLEANLAIGGAYCATAGTVVVRIVNPTVGAINPASQIFTVIGL